MNSRIVLALLLAAVAAGCSPQASTPMQPTPRGLALTPSDGATAVRLDEPVTLDFGAVVDRAAVEYGVHLIAEPDMSSACPDSTMGNHGTMESMMQDTSMLRHVGMQHATPGGFSWNDAGTSCTFRPDSLLRPQTRYMVHMSGAMLERMRQAGVGMMGGRMNPSGDMMLHFQTTTNDDHTGHH